jgi:potassium channel subfamily K
MGLSIQCFGLASLLIAVHFSMQKHEWPTKTKFTQAYYYAIFSSALSFTTLLSVVLHGLGVIWKYYTKQPRWSIVQRALLRQSIALTIYLLIGAVIFAETEDWAFLDAFFWADFTLLTIGLGGEFTPKKALGRTLLLPYAIIGIFLVALLVISIQKLLRRGCLHVTNQLTIRYVKQLQKTLTREGGAVYPMINKDIFNLIRRIETKAEKICGRIVLTVSIIAALVILLVGAAVFQIAEADQDWTYGVSCYFAYISLSTIGFGDYVPTSDAGKSFFVVWSLLAIPVLTVFINNSVDALYGTYRSLLLPFRRLFRGRRCQETKVQQSVGWAADIQDSIRPSAGKNNVLLEIRGTRVAQQAPACIKQDELSVNSMNQSNAASRATLRLHCYLLAQELRNTFLEMNSESPKRYTYEEWRYYVHLLGRFTVLAEENHDRKGKSKVPVEIQELLSIPPYMEAIEWVSQTSPLLSNSEPEWICLRLSSRLTELLSRMAAQD